MKATFCNASIKGICTIVPPKTIDIDSELDSIYKGDKKALERIKKVIGLQTRHIAQKHITASDLGELAAKRLLESLQIPKESIDALIFVTQSPDYFCPASACYLHGKLGLSQSCLSFDINQACAGYLYGLYMAYSLCDSGAANRVLLIVGDTLSKFVNPLDSNLAPMIGDGVSATFLERIDFAYKNSIDSSLMESHNANSRAYSTAKNGKNTKTSHSQNRKDLNTQGFVAGFGNNEVLDSIFAGNAIESKSFNNIKENQAFNTKQIQKAYFELGSDGSKFYQLIIPEGACRIPTKDIITDSKVWQTSEMRSLRDLYMDGAEIFNFAIMQYPKTFHTIMEYAQCDKTNIDYFFFHQANKYIVDNIARRLKLDTDKVPNTTTNKYGNLSGCSIPATICDTLAPLAHNGLEQPLKVHLAGFGAGLTWGNAVLILDRGFQCQKVEIYE